MDLIFCGGNNSRFANIAINAGFKYGCRIPTDKPTTSIYFADQDWKKPDRVAYMEALDKHRPHMATVLDWELIDQFDEVMRWAEEASQYVDHVIVIPKVINETYRIPHCIGGKEIVLGFSVPTKFGATSVPIWEFEGRSIHLLGGSPHRQMQEWQYLHATGIVVSADGNMASKMATQFCSYWEKSRWVKINKTFGHDATFESFRRSCINIKSSWDILTKERGGNDGTTRSDSGSPGEGEERGKGTETGSTVNH